MNGKYIKCIDNTSTVPTPMTYDLTVDKWYEIKGFSSSGRVFVEDDAGDTLPFNKERFDFKNVLDEMPK